VSSGSEVDVRCYEAKIRLVPLFISGH